MTAIEGPLSTRRELRRAVREFGQSLGADAETVASALVDLNVRGTPRSPYRCAIARYFQVIVGSEPTVTGIRVTDSRLHLGRSRLRLPLTVRLPKAVTEFIRAFDSNCYPHLVDRRQVRAIAPR